MKALKLQGLPGCKLPAVIFKSVFFLYSHEFQAIEFQLLAWVPA